MADVKFSELASLAAADSGDIFAIVDTSASTSKQLSINNLFGTVPVDVRVTDATDSSSATTGSWRFKALSTFGKIFMGSLTLLMSN